jgi:hypothetical protein
MIQQEDLAGYWSGKVVAVYSGDVRYNLPWRPRWGVEVYLYLSLTSALDGGGWSTPRPGRFTPAKDTRYPLYKKMGGPQGRSGRVRKISPPPGFDPRIVQLSWLTFRRRYTSNVGQDQRSSSTVRTFHARGSGVGRGTALQAGRSRVRFPMVTF